VIVLFTDFGLTGPYTGQVKAVLQQRAPAVPVIDLFADAPMQNPKAAAYLLAVYFILVSRRQRVSLRRRPRCRRRTAACHGEGR
jgi:S-adenosylmethionine hydrolase